ncbi:DUF3870 domain-containing protein [Moorella sulfitireducens (nom. illeg.)]|uniref:DUF3870 domain-containing protein n=1 Tax=Neomoorella sulfitireducens TaxID=2972948 RepID=UPI0021AD17F8|nr:DUF3870 domain-containing protein [Moorella sulfitireducens]
MRKTHIFCGQAQLPQGTDIYEKYKYLTVLLEVDMDSGLVMECYFPIYCEMCNHFMADILRGRSLDEGLDPVIAEIEERVHLVSKKALINALYAAYNRYLIVKKNLNRTNITA